MSQYYDAFISYGRADSKAFATQLYNDLTKQGFKIWFDQNDIPLGVDFQNQIDDGIEKSHNFLFIIAPHSVNSPYCLKEIELAVKYKKRIIPLLHVEEISYETWQGRNPGKTEADWEQYQQQGRHSSFPNMHPEIGRINWVYFRENVENYDKSLADLIKLFHNHEDYVQKHTQILVKALEWERHQKLTRYLLIGQERLEAEDWLKIEFKNEQPPCLPNDLQCEFICESIKNGNNLLTLVFLAYGKEDRETMLKIRKCLMRHGITVWTNQTDIKTGGEFKQAIKRGIEGADNFVYLLSREALKSEYCQQELARAFKLNKRIISLLIKPTDLATIPKELQELQFIDLTAAESEDEYQKNLDKLIKELRENAVYYEEHKVLLVKALKWQEQNRNRSILLRGYNLDRYQSWLEVARTKKLHPPTDLQVEFIAESAKQPPDLVLDVFLSYSRADSDFARKLNDALQTQGKTTWFDQESIATGTDFAAEIHRGIEQSDNFLFVISPDSVNSQYCADEVEYARSLNKRFVTVLHRGVNCEELHPELAKVQWLDFNRHGGDFYASFSELVRTLDTDREYVREHTKKSQMALEWKRGNKTIDLLLRGSEYARAYEWLREAQGQKKQPAASEEIEEFILESKVEVERLEKKERRRKNTIAAAALGTIAALSGLSIFAWGQKLEAERQSAIALARQLAAESRTATAEGGLQQRGTLLAVESVKKFQKLDRSSVAADGALRSALGSLPDFVSETNHDGSIGAIAFSTDGKYLATASGDRTARVWDAATGREIAELSHDGDVSAVAFSADGKYVATGSWDNTARVWDAVTGREIAAIGHRGPVMTVVFSSDNNYLATAGRQDNTLRLWDAAAGKVVGELSHDGEVWAVAFSRDGKYVLTASADGTARRWDATGKEVSKFNHDGSASLAAFSSDGEYLVILSNDNRVLVWDVTPGEKVAEFNHDDEVIALAFSADGKYLATGNWDYTAKVWALNAGKEVASLDHFGPVSALTFSRDGKYLATASYDKIARVWDTDSGKEVAKLNHDSRVSVVAFSADGKYVASAGYDKTARVWKLTAGPEVATLKHDREVDAIAFSADGKYLATGSNDYTARVWAPSTGKELVKLDRGSRLNTVLFSPDGKYLATVASRGVLVSQSATGTEVAKLKHDRVVMAVAFSPDSKYLVTAVRQDSTARVWDASTGKEIAALNHDSPVNALAFSGDGNYIATGSWNKTVGVWDAATGSELLKFNHDASVRAVAFSPDSKYLASASNDYTARIWELNAGEEVAKIDHNSSLFTVIFSRDGKYLATASDDNIVRVWNVSTGKQVAEFHHDWFVNDLVFSADSKYVATASSDYSAWVWEISTGKAVSQLNHDREVLAVAFSPDGKYLATASWDNTARVHILKPQDLINEACRRLYRNLTVQEWEKYMNFDLNKYQKTCDNLPVHPSVLAKGRELAKGGKIKEAAAIFRRVLELEADIDLDPDIKENDPEAVARKLAAN